MAASLLARIRIPIRWPTVTGVAFACLWALIFCIPWEDEVTVGQGVAISHVVGAAAFAMGIFDILMTARVRGLHPLHWLFLILVAWMGITYSWSLEPDLTVVRITSFAQLLMLVWLLWQFAQKQEQQVSLLGAYVLGCYVSSVSTIYAYIAGTGLNRGFADGRYTAVGFDENELGVTLALGVVMAWYLLIQRPKAKVLWLLYIPLGIFAIMLTGSRGAVISTGVGSLMLPLTFRYYNKRQRWLMATSFVVLLGVAAAFLPQSSWERLASINGEVSQGTLSKRTYIWDAGVEVYRQHPVIGVGAGAFAASVTRRLDVPLVAHNSYLSILVELGMVGAILFFTLWSSLFLLAFSMTGLKRRLWTVLMLTWSTAVLSLTWEHRKPTWFLFGLLIAQSATCVQARYRGSEPLPVPA